MILINILRHFFADVWTLQVIRHYKIGKLAFIYADGDTPITSNEVDVLNNDNVNRICGWGIWNLKRKCKKLINNCCVNSVYKGENPNVREHDVCGKRYY